VSRLPLISGKDMCVLLAGLGFAQVRRRGSHALLAHPDGRTLVVPVHAGEDLGRGLIRTILREAHLSVEEYVKLRGR